MPTSSQTFNPSNKLKIVELYTLCMPVSATLLCLNVSQSIVCITEPLHSPGVPKLTPGYGAEEKLILHKKFTKKYIF